jgi:hypothetical protein
MAFLDNSGDIILDAVLTDTGRKRLAKGNGSFSIDKYAFGDDEINYELYRNNNSPQGIHPSGSQFYDDQIFQTPILEAFARNVSSIKSKLMIIPTNEFLFLSIIKPWEGSGFEQDASSNSYIVAVDLLTVNTIGNVSVGGTSTGLPAGVMNGYNPTVSTAGIRVDQGIDNAITPPEIAIDDRLKETSYYVQMDNRLGALYGLNSSTPAAVSFVDEDNIATYVLSLGSNQQFVTNLGTADVAGSNSSLRGSRGTKLQFKIGATISTRGDDYYFNTLGSAATSPSVGSMSSYSFIDSTLSITGVHTGYRVDLPLRYVKKI